jgi:hypothetical protein
LQSPSMPPKSLLSPNLKPKKLKKRGIIVPIDFTPYGRFLNARIMAAPTITTAIKIAIDIGRK